MANRNTCPVTVIVGDDLTSRMIDDYRPYLKPTALPGFEESIAKFVEEIGPVTRIELEGFRDGSPGYHTKKYWFGDEYDPDCPLFEFMAAMAGVERFPED